MTDYRSEAEKFVSAFLDYAQKDSSFLDYFNKRTQKMERSLDVQKLIKRAEAVFPPRVDDGKDETDKLTLEQMDEAIQASSNVVDTREMFGRRTQANGGTRALLRALYNGEPGAGEAVLDFLQAEDGEKEFADK